jgi:hypothetical protein
VNKLEEVRPHAANGRADMFDIIRLSRDIMASAVSEWLRSANRCQGDAIRFVKDCFDRDIAAVSELAACKNAQEVIGLTQRSSATLFRSTSPKAQEFLPCTPTTGIPCRPPGTCIATELPHASTTGAWTWSRNFCQGLRAAIVACLERLPCPRALRRLAEAWQSPNRIIGVPGEAYSTPYGTHAGR